MALDPIFIQKIHDAPELLDWLREMPSDRNFAAGIEMSMGRSELESPVELWISADNGVPGRPDEQKLSMLNSVRSHLHEFIYRPKDRLDSLSSAVDLLSRAQPEQSICVALEECSRLLVPLSQLLSDQTDITAPSRLFQLMLPEAHSEWVIRTDAEVAGELHLEYNVTTHNGATLRKHQSLEELTAFQSTVVLARAGLKDDQGIIQCISSFTKQFAWLKELASVFTELHLRGHFDFEANMYRTSLSIATVDTVLNECAKAKATLADWLRSVNTIRRGSRVINHLSMPQLWAFRSALESSQVDGTDSLRSIYNCLNPHCDGAEFEPFELQVRNLWVADISAPSCSGFILQQCTQVLEQSLGADWSPGYRSVSLDVQQVIAADLTKPRGVYIGCISQSDLMDTSQYSAALLAFLQAGQLPEWHQLLVCRVDTPVTELDNAIFRWCNDPHARLHCLAMTECLGFDLQRHAADLISELSSLAKAPLLILSTKSDSQYLVSHFSANRVTVIPPSPGTVQQVVNDVSFQAAMKGSFTIWSGCSGSGKTFAIRQAAHQAGCSYQQIPVNQMTTRLELAIILGQIPSTKQESALCYIHLDVADAIEEKAQHLRHLENSLFELAFFGCIPDPVSKYWYHQQGSHIAVELSFGCFNAVKSNVLVPVQMVVTNSAMFESTEGKLQHGNWLCTADADSLSSPYLRLQYVCCALQQRRNLLGSFPADFNWDNTHLDGATCFELLESAMDQVPGRTSLWCVWNFVNVLYRQLSNMMMPDSPLLPLFEVPEKDEGNKLLGIRMQRLRGEAMAFISRTSCSFSMRQTSTVSHPI